jgi:hypothetical protein
MKIRIDPPEDNMLKQLAPRVAGRYNFIGEYGYAVALDSKGQVHVFWDDGGDDWVDPASLIFLSL